ncbi:negative elongation factor D-like [Anopheles maculipalpis]|uniref:negative elongation factor D-like n=1 Tax=Anopheles maculipalpis TaxID=1496333 RepID=UPI0021592BF0|nr:negative elongation factor D-like [Anopheles maculipalpis]
MEKNSSSEANSPDSPAASNAKSQESALAIVHDCLQRFGTQDYIMEPEIFGQLRRYVTAGGTPKMAIDQLSDNYTGVAQMVNMVGSWLLTIGADAAELTTMVENILKDAILKSFDPQIADSIFTENSPPEWLWDAIQFPTWRSLIYRLVEKHPDCLLLNFTLKLISSAGYLSEITSNLTSSSNFELFLTIFQSTILNYLRQPDANTFERVAKVVCYRQHTYVLSQVLLHKLSERVGCGPIIKRLSQEMTNYATQLKSHSNVVPITMALNGSSGFPAAYAALSSILTTNALKSSDIFDLHRCYASSVPPPINLIRNQQFLDLLINSIFNVKSKLDQKPKSKEIFLLGIAASVCETGIRKGSWLGSVRTSNVVEVKDTIHAIEAVHTICCNKSTNLLPYISTIFNYLEYPVVAIGVFRWASSIVSDASYFNLGTDRYPLHFALMDEIARLHTSLHDQIVQLFARILESKLDHLEVFEQLNFKRMLLDRMVNVLACGGAIPVVRYIAECYARDAMDISLIRYIVKEVLDIVGPPYSREFVQLFLPMVENTEISGTIVMEDGTDSVTEFIVQCKACFE